MLVLTRRIHESVMVGEVRDSPMLKMTVLAIFGDRVKLGFEMDDDVEVRRLEVRNRLPIAEPVEFSARASDTNVVVGPVLDEIIVPIGGVVRLRIADAGDES